MHPVLLVSELQLAERLLGWLDLFLVRFSLTLPFVTLLLQHQLATKRSFKPQLLQLS